MADETPDPQRTAYLGVHSGAAGPGASRVQVQIGPGLIVDVDSAGRVLGIERVGGPVEFGDLWNVLLALPFHHWVDGQAQAVLVRAGMTGPEGEHLYYSTGCHHEDHDYCKGMTGVAGVKQPSICKGCGVACLCCASEVSGG